MTKFFKERRVLLVFLALAFWGCRKEEFDKFYGRPENLAPPIYQQLEGKRNFTRFLECVDKAGYKQTLSSAGSWTVFPANDSAFNAFLQEEGISEISEALASKVVRYSMIYDGEKLEKLTDYFSRSGFVPYAAFRRRTVYYDFVYDGKNSSGNPIKVISANRHGFYLASDFNNKYIPYFFDPFMSRNFLSASDYHYFYPNSVYTGLNVGPASISSTGNNIIAENGVIHIVDKVLVPPMSIEQHISQSPEYAQFDSLLQRFANYSLNTDISKRYQAVSGSSASVYAKTYSSNLAFSPNNENYQNLDANDAQQGMNSMIVPTNEALNQYAKKVLLKYYWKLGTKDLKALAVIRPDIIQDYVKATMYTYALWPSQFETAANAFAERNDEVSRIGLSHIVERKSLSNGFFYGSSKSPDATAFSSVYGKVNLDPDYSLTREAFRIFGYDLQLKTANTKYALVLVNDAQLNSMNFRYDPYYPNSIQGDNVALKRYYQTHIIPLPRYTVDFVNGSGMLETNAGEFIRYDKGKLYSAGLEEGVAIDSIVNSPDELINGQVIYVSKVLNYSTTALVDKLKQYAATASDPYYSFYMFLTNNAVLYNSVNKTITGVNEGEFYTFLIPTNTAIRDAVKAGDLPGNTTTGEPTYNFSGANLDKVSKFLLAHIIRKKIVVPNGLGQESYESLYKTPDDVYFRVEELENTRSSLKFKTNRVDANGKAIVASVILSGDHKSNVLANRAVFHQIDQYIKVNP